MLLSVGSEGGPKTSLALIAISIAVFALAAMLCLWSMRICRVRNWLAKPRADRWHRSSPARFGGVPLWISFVVGCAIVVRDALAWKVIAVASLMFVLGLLDDIYDLRPRIKLAGQILAAALMVGMGVVYPLRADPIVNGIVSAIWLVAVTNAFNLLDNMDGLAAGVAIISAFYLGVFYFHAGLLQYVVLLVVFGAAATAFLLFNFRPARIFMGDAGSLFLGFLLGSMSLLQVTHLSGFSAFLFIPVLVLAIPLLDTFFVSITRKMRGQPISQGGVDHSSHRLARLGIDERSVVVLLYILSAFSGAVALFLRRLNANDAIGLVAFWFLFLIVFGIHVFHSPTEAHEHLKPPFRISERLFNRDVLVVVLDPAVICLSYYVSYLLRFPGDSHVELPLFFASWPVVVGVKFLSLRLCGIHRDSWWRNSRLNVYRLFRATVLGEVVAVLVLTALYHFAGYSRLVFLIDAAISFAVLAGIRSSFVPFHDLVSALRTRQPVERRVFVVGTSELTSTAIRYLAQNHIYCVGLIDNNGGSDLGRRIWGKHVLGRIDDLARLAAEHQVNEIVLAEKEELPLSEEAFAALCQEWKLRITKLGLYAATQAAAAPSAHPGADASSPEDRHSSAA